jgi:hypothetical protein
MTYHSFLRLKMMVIVQLTGSMIFNSFVLWYSTKNGIRPYPGWAAAHKDFQQIPLVPIVFWGENYVWILLMWWAAPACALTFFALFSFTSDVRKECRAGYAWFLRVVVKRHVKEQEPPVSKLCVFPVSYLAPLSLSFFTRSQRRHEGALLSVSSFRGIKHISHHSFTVDFHVISHRDDTGVAERHLLPPSPAVLRTNGNHLLPYYFPSPHIPSSDKSR